MTLLCNGIVSHSGTLRDFYVVNLASEHSAGHQVEVSAEFLQAQRIEKEASKIQ